MRKFSKILSILLVLTLILPSFVFAEENINVETEKIFDDVNSRFRSDENLKVKLTDGSKKFKSDDEVRIIVELKSKPSIVYATEKNISYSELNNAKQIEEDILLEQENVKKDIKANGIEIEYLHSFKTTFNGFSGIVKYKDIEKIEKLPLVKKVYIANEYERPEPNMETSKDMIGTNPTWNIGYKGEGTVIAIIDTGIDPSHKDMVLSEGTNPKLTQEDVENLIEEENLLGKYFTEKVPYGYNYYDLNYEILDLGPNASEHGMHVAGTAAANGDEENGGIKGVAPEAQLLAMKVFSNDPIYTTTYSDIYLKAIDEAIKLGADVLNMSLGSTAGFYIPDSAENVAITNAVDNGIVCSVSAGNSGHFVWGWELYDLTYAGFPWKENPDVGVVGSPGLNKDTIQVASIDNTHQKVNYLTYELNGETHKAPMAIAGDINPASVFQGPVEFADGGYGDPSELTDVEGKVALIERGGSPAPFVDKLTNAQNAGAIGVIVRNHQSGGDELINMATPDDLRIPAVFIGYNDGLALMSLEEKYVTFTDDLMTIPNPTGGLMSDFSSWGTTPSLDLKPEITAPGGLIYSTLQNNEYGIMSGTSMAAPHVAGGAALVMEYIKEHPVYSQLSLGEQARLAKVLLMNTADIVHDEYGTEYSPRKQGAGLMNLYGAVTTPVRVVDADTDEAKVELRDFDDTSFTMEFKAINDSDTDATYNVDVSVLKDFIYPYAGKELNLLSSDYIRGATIDAPETIVVPANDEVTFEVTVDIGTDDTIYENMFVEGFVSLIDPNDENPTLSVPYVGFYGDWGEPKILDNMKFIDPEGTSYFGISGMIYFDYEESGFYYSTPIIYMSPGTTDGMLFGTGNVIPYLSFLRNAEYVNYNILDEDGNLLRTILTQQYYRKDYVNGGLSYPVALVTDAAWYGDVNGEILPDGDYYYEIEAKIHYDGAEVQSKKIPVTIDTVVPEITNITFNSETNKLSFNAEDDRSGILGFIVYVNDEEIEEIPVLIDEEESLYEVDLTNSINSIGRNTVKIVALDNAFNTAIASTVIGVDSDYGSIFLLTPKLFEIFTENQITAEGYVTGFGLLDKVLVNGEEAEIEYVEYVDIANPEDGSILYSGPAYKFTKTIELDDGYHDLIVEAVSETGSTSSIARKIFVDTTSPELEVKVTNIDYAAAKADLEIRMFDNLGNLTLYLDDSEIYRHEEPLVTPNPEEKIINYTVNLDEAVNNFNFKLVDLAGHETYENVKIEVISNIQPSEDVEIKAGETVTISFNAPTGGQGYYKVMLPVTTEDANGIPMEEENGLYKGVWTAPEDMIVSDLQVEVTYITLNGKSYVAMAEGSITIVGDIEKLPVSAVIVNEKAYHIDYLNNDADAQTELINWMDNGNEIYFKLDENTIINTDGDVVSIDDLPNRLVYYDQNGNQFVYKK